MSDLKEYQKAKKGRHIVNGVPFKEAFEAMQYIEKSGFALDRIERIFSITIYHVKNAG